VADFLWEDVICRWGCFEQLGCDGGSENKLFTESLLHLYQIRKVQISPYNSHAAGAIEVKHRILLRALMKLTKGGTKNFRPFLHAALWADRTTVKDVSGMTPARMMLGEEHVLPIELELRTWQTLPWAAVRMTEDLIELRARQIDRRNEDVEEAKARLIRMREAANERWEDEHAERLRDKSLEIGDLVLLHHTKVAKDFGGKLSFVWLGPYRIREVLLSRQSNLPIGTYLLEELDGTAIKTAIHGDRLKIFYPLPAEDDERDEQDESIVGDLDGEGGGGNERDRSNNTRWFSHIPVNPPAGFSSEDYIIVNGVFGVARSQW
jgi:hypothetical protein